MITLAKAVTGLFAFIAKELTELARSPAALLSLVLGPLLIIILFGMSFSGFAPDLRAIVVLPPDSELSSDVADYADIAQGIQIVEVTTDQEAAIARLEARAIDAVLVAPADVEGNLEAGERSTVGVFINASDPIAELNAAHVAAALSAALNRRIIEEAVRLGQEQAIEAGITDADRIPPEVVASPTTTEFENVAPVKPSILAFYGAALLPFVIQHLAVSLVALSLVRERSTGSFELFRVAPVSAAEVVLGKAVAFALISGVVAVATALVLVKGLNVPLLGDPIAFGLTMVVLILASLGLGVLVGVISNSERQVVQLALLVLLASVFFSGLVLKLDLFEPIARPFAYLLPATHGIEVNQDLMLYGWVSQPWHLGALLALAAAFGGIGLLGFRRQLARD